MSSSKALSVLGSVALAALLAATVASPAAAPVVGGPATSGLLADAHITELDGTPLGAVGGRFAPPAAGRGAARSAVPALAETTADSLDSGDLLPPTATPAPANCEYTSLTHLFVTDDLCASPRLNNTEQNQALGKYLAARRGWEGDQWQCLDNLITRESRWRHTAANPVSTARGIPQKMMSVHYGANWRTSPVAAEWLANPEPQIEWGLDYIARRYTDPCGAWGFFLRNGWY